MTPKILVFDDALPDIDQVRAQALSLEYKEVESEGVKYPGINLELQKEMRDRLCPVIASLMRWKTMVAKLSFFRLSVESHKPQIYIHADGQHEAKWAAILYMTPDEDCVGGTAFWKHRETGWCGLPDGREDLAQSFIEAGKTESLWEMTDLVGMRYNRLVIFKSNQFHARYPEIFPGKEKEQGRHSFVMFFDNPDDSRAES
jgi:hypothetical protein